MRYLQILFVLCLLSSCFSRTSMMTRENFDDIYIGTPIDDVENRVGEPYAIHTRGGKDEYEYIEVIEQGDHLYAENHYFLLVSNGQVVSKRMTYTESPAFDLLYQEDPQHLRPVPPEY